MRAILFDCDGTIADSFGIIVGTMRKTFEAAGLAVPADADIRGIIGLSLDVAIQRLAPSVKPGAIASLVGLYKETFHRQRNELALREALFPGAETLLRQLAARDDVFVGMVTGKSRRGVAAIIQAHGLEGIFQAVRTADDCPSKPHPAMVLECCSDLHVAPENAIVVGDSVFDIQMAVAARADAIGVTWGAASAGDLAASGASLVVSTMDALTVALEERLGQRLRTGTDR